MSDRRAFLRAAGGAALRARAPFGAYAQAAPKRVTVGGRRVSIIDVHAHCVFPDVSRRVPGINAPRVAPPTLVLGPERLAAMDERGIDVQALSVNAYWWYSANRDDARAVVATHDEGIAAWCKEHPTRFVGLSSVALQFPGPRSRAARARRQESWARVARRSAVTSTTSRPRARNTIRSGPKPRSSACRSSCIRTTR